MHNVGVVAYSNQSCRPKNTNKHLQILGSAPYPSMYFQMHRMARIPSIIRILEHPKNASCVSEEDNFRRSLSAKLQRALEPHPLITRNETLATAAYLAPWSLTLQVTSDKTIWVAPPPFGNPNLSSGAEGSMKAYVAGTLAALTIMLNHSAHVPNATIVFQHGDNCLYVLNACPMRFDPCASCCMHGVISLCAGFHIQSLGS